MNAVVDGAPCELQFRDRLGNYVDPGPFFYHDDGHWYRIEPPTLIEAKPSHYRPL